jgi:hypothetical protein
MLPALPEVHENVIDDLFGRLFGTNDGKAKTEQGAEVMTVKLLESFLVIFLRNPV